MNHYALTRLAGQDIDSIWDYIAITLGNPNAANRIVDSLHRSFSTLSSFPYMGTLADDLADILPGIRMFPVPSTDPPYKVYYVPIANGIRVIRVFHSKQDYLQIELHEEP